jgi:hypothetical protein
VRPVGTIVSFRSFLQRPAVVASAASIVAGTALWLSRAAFDLAGTAESPERVAMLPGLSELAGLITLTFLFIAGMAWLLRVERAGGDHVPFWDPVFAEILLPLFALCVLWLPYLPWVPDWIPALRIFAGPGRMIVWVIVVGQFLWLFLPELARRRRLLATGAGFWGSIAVFASSVLVYGWVFSRLKGTEDPFWLPVIAAAGVAALAWIWSAEVSGSKSAATFAWAAVFLSGPFVMNSGSLFTGVVADVVRAIRGLPSARLGNLVSSVPGLLFDQEFGFVAYAPVLLLAVVGVAGMTREHRRTAILVSAVAVTLLVLAGTLEPWWSDSVMPGRTLLFMLPLLTAPIAWVYARASGFALRRAALRILLLMGLAVTAAIVLLPAEIPLPQEGDGASAVLYWFSPTWRLSNDAPSYVTAFPLAALGRTALWLAPFALAGWWISGRRNAGEGPAALFSAAAAVISVIAIVSVSAAFPPKGEPPGFDPEARVLFPMLETFNPVARPFAVRYDPLSVVDPSELPSLFTLAALPAQRRNRQPVRVVLNARFRLPAGDYQLELTGSDAAGTVPNAVLGLQIGREGRPLETWPLTLAPGGRSQHRFTVPLDAEFVGFRATRQVERTIGELRLRALGIVEARRRFPTPTVRAAADFGVARVFFHDGDSYPEAEGFWVRGRSAVQVTIVKRREHDPSITLAIHSGPTPNTLTLDTAGWSQRIDLVPGVTAKVVTPTKAGERFIPLTITSSNGFVPAELDRASKDRRLLGAWIAFLIPDDISRTSAVP